MWKIYFGELTFGRLRRLQFLGYAMLLLLLMFGFMLAIVLAIGAGEHLLGGDLQEAQDKLRGWFGVPATFFVLLISLLGLIAKLNIMAKRIRDIGLRGWWIVLALLVVAGGLSVANSGQSGGALFSIFWILLLLIPSNTFGNK